jgi:PAS domain S-box-containing protein
MRSRAESLTHLVMDVTPDAILIVDRALHIQAFSPSAEKMFNCRRSQVLGQPLPTIDPVVKDFWAVRESGEPILNQMVYLREDLAVEQNIVPVGGENLIVAILRDVTERERQHREMERLRTETLARSKEVIRRQMHVAHEIAGLLGETTADTKVLLTQLARLMDEPVV